MKKKKVLVIVPRTHIAVAATVPLLPPPRNRKIKNMVLNCAGVFLQVISEVLE
jgi:hypothetical protein